MKFRKKPVIIDAAQWWKPGDHPAVKTRSAGIVFSYDELYYYVSSAAAPTLANAWLAVDPNSDVAVRHGAVLPFEFYQLRAGRVAHVSEYPVLTKQYDDYMGWKTQHVDYGKIETLEGPHLVTPGDWIITGVRGEHYACKPDIFEQTYEVVND